MTEWGPFNERSSGRVIVLLVDEKHVALDATRLSTLPVTLYDVASGTVINGRLAQDLMGAAGVTLYATPQIDAESGKLYNVEWLTTPADMPAIGTAPIETHVALFQPTWLAGTKSCTHEIGILVRNLARVA